MVEKGGPLRTIQVPQTASLYIKFVKKSGCRRGRETRRRIRKTRYCRGWYGFLAGTWEFFWLFLHTSSIHGLKYLPPTKKFGLLERLTWHLVVVLAVWGSLSLSGQTLRRFMTNPTVVAMEHNYKEWNTSFPSITICPTAKYSDEKVEALINKMFGHVEDKESLGTFLRSLANSTYGKFGDVPLQPAGIRPMDYWIAVSRSAYRFVYNVSNSNTDGYGQVDMNPVMTEVGLCYSYNSAATIYNDPKIWEAKKWKYLGKIKMFEGSPLDGDIFAQVMNMNSGYGLYLLDPEEFPDVAIPQIEGSNNSYKTLDLTALSIVSSPATRGLSVEQRRCRLPSESELLTSPVYSYNLCRMECRMKAALHLCNCVPFFYRPTENFPVCDTRGMKCIDRHSDVLIKLRDPSTDKKLPCVCLPLCHEVNYIIDTDNTMSWTLGTNLKWGLIKYPKFRLKRDILFGWTDLLVSIGGTAGLFLGCSLLSFAEILYFLTLRLFWFVVKRNRMSPPSPN